MGCSSLSKQREADREQTESLGTFRVIRIKLLTKLKIEKKEKLYEQCYKKLLFFGLFV